MPVDSSRHHGGSWATDSETVWFVVSGGYSGEWPLSLSLSYIFFRCFIFYFFLYTLYALLLARHHKTSAMGVCVVSTKGIPISVKCTLWMVVAVGRIIALYSIFRVYMLLLQYYTPSQPVARVTSEAHKILSPSIIISYTFWNENWQKKIFSYRNLHFWTKNKNI